MKIIANAAIVRINFILYYVLLCEPLFLSSFKWSYRQDSNLQRSAHEALALPLSYCRMYSESDSNRHLSELKSDASAVGLPELFIYVETKGFEPFLTRCKRIVLPLSLSPHICSLEENRTLFVRFTGGGINLICYTGNLSSPPRSRTGISRVKVCCLNH